MIGAVVLGVGMLGVQGASTVRLTTAKVTPDSLHYVWETDGPVFWQAVSGKEFDTVLTVPTTQILGRHRFEIQLKVTRFKKAGMDVHVTRAHQELSENGRGRGYSSATYVGLPEMPLTKIVKLLVKKDPVKLPKPGRVELAEFSVPASQFMNYEALKFEGRKSKVVSSTRVRLVNGQPPNSVFEIPAVKDAMKKGYQVSGPVTPATKGRLAIVVE